MNPYDFLVTDEKGEGMEVDRSSKYNPYDLSKEERERFRLQESVIVAEEKDRGEEEEEVVVEPSPALVRSRKPKDILRYLNNNKKNDVYFSWEERCFKKISNRDPVVLGGGKKRREETYVKGLLPALKRMFWPTYQYNEPSYKNTKNTGLKSQKHGIYRGDLVHTQIELYVNKGGLPILDSLYGDEGIHEFTVRALLALREWKLRPVVSELLVYDARSNVATKADLLCLNSKGELVLIEWKCGMDNYFFAANDTMRGPLENVYSNCPSNQAYIQLMFTKILLERSYDLKIRRSYVVQIKKGTIDPFSLPKLLLNNENRIDLYLETKILEEQKTESHKRRKKNRSG